MRIMSRIAMHASAVPSSVAADVHGTMIVTVGVGMPPRAIAGMGAARPTVRSDARPSTAKIRIFEYLSLFI